MASFSFAKFMFILLISSLVISVQNAQPSTPYALVNKVCSGLGNVNFCLEVLKSDGRSKFATNITTLTTIAVDVATQNTTKTRDFFQGVKTGPPGVLKSLVDCIPAYNTVISEFTVCLKEEDCDLTALDIHDAGDEVKRCQAIADSNGAHDSFITTSNNVAQNFCSLGESLANLMCPN